MLAEMNGSFTTGDYLVADAIKVQNRSQIRRILARASEVGGERLSQRCAERSRAGHEAVTRWCYWASSQSAHISDMISAV